MAARKPLVLSGGQVQQLQSDEVADIGYPTHGFKNAIINGDFRFWQRGTSTASSSVYLADRWQNNFNGSGITRTDSRQAFGTANGLVNHNAPYFFRTEITGTISGATSNFIQQKIESVETFQGRQVSVSFWAKADASRTLGVRFLQQFGTGGSPSGDVSTSVGNASLTTSWQRFSYTVPLPSTSGLTIGSDGNDRLTLRLDFPLNTACTIDLFGVQVEAGPVATDFEYRPLTLEELLCRRYCWVIGQALIGTVAGTTAVAAGPPLPPMRATPSVSLSTTTPIIRVFAVGTFTGTGATVAIALNSTGAGIGVIIDGFSGLTVGQSFRLDTGTVTIDAEL